MKTGNGKTAPRRGTVLVYSLIMMSALTGFCSLAVDWGHVQLVKTQLHTAVDAAARAGASGLAVDATTVIARARATALANKADGTPVDLDINMDIEIGIWDSATRHFTRTGDASSANAVRVIARRIAARGNGVTMTMAQMVGHRQHNVQCEAIAAYTPAVNVNQSIQGTANPFLSGMPTGTVASLNNPHHNPDFAGTPANPRQSPIVAPLSIHAGQALNFDSINGTVRHDPKLEFYSPDGQFSDYGHNTNGGEHGISDLTAPINALVGVFLSDAQPDATRAPSAADFSTSASRDFKELRPELKQMFFIGDGVDSSGARQNFIAPPGATRLFLATWDFYEWNNNAGSRVVRIIRPEKIVIVK